MSDAGHYDQKANFKAVGGVAFKVGEDIISEGPTYFEKMVQENARNKGGSR